MSEMEIEIRECFKRMNCQLASPAPLSNGKRFDANSQYGYSLGVFDTLEKAEQFTVSYYSKRMNLIRQ